jgi:hypothetical protein
VDEEKQMLGSIKEQPFLNAGSEVFTALWVGLEVAAVFWAVAPCSRLDVNQSFEEIFCLYLQGS